MSVPSKFRAACSPPARGWTVDDVDSSEWSDVLPARAGMDRRTAGRAWCSGWCSPPARGWTVEDLKLAADERRAPRPRGDGPCPVKIHRITLACSPPARGWTACRPPRRGPQRRAPRPRGDGPATAAPDSCTNTVLPARAGMDRCPDPSPTQTPPCSPPARGWTGDEQGGELDAGRAPRPRGDGPLKTTQPVNAASVLPARAGMDRASAAPTPPRSVLPARAGMDRRSPTCSAPSSGAPRPRGDGPGWAGYSPAAPARAPRPRGDGPRGLLRTELPGPIDVDQARSDALACPCRDT